MDSLISCTPVVVVVVCAFRKSSIFIVSLCQVGNGNINTSEIYTMQKFVFILFYFYDNFGLVWSLLKSYILKTSLYKKSVSDLFAGESKLLSAP